MSKIRPKTLQTSFKDLNKKIMFPKRWRLSTIKWRIEAFCIIIYDNICYTHIW